MRQEKTYVNPFVSTPEDQVHGIFSKHYYDFQKNPQIYSAHLKYKESNHKETELRG